MAGNRALLNSGDEVKVIFIYVADYTKMRKLANRNVGYNQYLRVLHKLKWLIKSNKIYSVGVYVKSDT